MKKNLASDAYEQIRTMIETGRISQGKSLVENDLCDALSMSRTPIRESLSRLHSEGFVEHEKNKGYSVSTFSVEKIKQIYEAIEANESMLMYLMAQEHHDFDDGRKAVEEMEQALVTQDWESWASADTRFHQALYVQCANEYITRNIEILNRTALQVRYMITKLYLDKDISTKAHREIYNAIASGNAEAARMAAQKHFSWVRNEVITCMRKSGLY